MGSDSGVEFTACLRERGVVWCSCRLAMKECMVAVVLLSAWSKGEMDSMIVCVTVGAGCVTACAVSHEL